MEVVCVSLPTGTVTFLLTDIEGSTRLWEHQGPSHGWSGDAAMKRSSLRR